MMKITPPLVVVEVKLAFPSTESKKGMHRAQEKKARRRSDLDISRLNA